MKRVIIEILDWIKTFVIIFVVVTVVHKYVFTPVKVDGSSMYPTLHHDDSVILWELNYEPDLFDVIVFEYEPDVYYVKRIIGLPGDTIRYEQDQLYRNDEPILEPFLDDGKQEIGYFGSFTNDFTLEGICQFEVCDEIPAGYYLVLGDNRQDSKDSRSIGLVKEDQILGKATFIQWPLNRMGKIH